MRKFLSKPCKDGKPAVEFPIRDIAAGGLHTSVLDLALFMQAMLAGGGKILKPDTVAEMLKPQNAGVPLDMDLKIGLAWHLYDPGELSYAGRTAFHDGATLHYQTTFVMLPDHRLGVVAMSNSPGSKTLMYRASTDALKIMLQAKAGIKPPPPPTTPPDAESPPPAAALKAVEGNYATSFGNVRITARQDRLDAEISGHRARLVPLEGGGFRPEIRFMGFTVRIKELDGVTAHFTKVAGLDSMIGKTQGGTFLAGTKTDRVPIPEAWSRRVGRYMLANRDGDQLYIDDVAVSVDDGSLTMEFSLPGITHERAKFILLPCSDTEAVTAGYGRYMGETVNVISTGNSESLHYSGFIFKRD
jgi:hypothetical protein